MNNTRLISIDLAKNVFQICVMNKNKRVVENKAVRRSQLAVTMSRRKPCRVVMEACYSSHYWGRVFESMGHQVSLIPAQHVKPFVRGNKNDNNDAIAIAEAFFRPHIKFVPIKTEGQQDVQALHRIRQRIVRQRTGLINQTRGILSEYGIIAPQGPAAFKQLLVKLCDPDYNGLTPIMKGQLQLAKEEFDAVSHRLDRLNKELNQLAHQDPLCRLLMTIPGIGYTIATATISAVGKGQQFNHAREMAVWLGVTPKQHASGDKSRMQGITKRGDRYLRALYIHGARAAINMCKRPNDPVLNWAKSVQSRRGKHKAVVALANRLARLAWTLLQKQEVYQPA